MSDFAPRTKENLLPVLASTGGYFQPRESLQPFATVVKGAGAAPANQLAAYTYLGDMMVRFMFSAKGCEDAPARLEDVERMDLTPARALVLATMNLKAAHGVPQSKPLAEGVYTLCGDNPNVRASHFLDRSYWRSHLDRSPQGVWVAMPRRDSVLFAYASDPAATKELMRLAANLSRAAGDRGLSGYVYRFDAQGWHIHERLLPSPAADDDPGSRADRSAELDEEERQERLALAAAGQKMVIYGIVLNMLLSAAERNNVLPDVALWGLYVCVAVYALLGCVKICSGLGKTQAQKILFMVLAFFPLINVVAIVYLSVNTSRMLRDAGWKVGLLGARP